MISGLGVILFGVWSIVKIILTVVYRPDLITGSSDAADAASPAVAVLVLFIFFLVPDLLLRMYVGLSARAEARGRKKGYGYVVVAWIMAAVLVAIIIFGTVAFIQSGTVDPGTIVDEAVVWLVDITSASALVEVAVSAMRVKKLQG